MLNSKKQQELGYLDSLRYFCNELQEREVISGETPDFVLAADNHRLGIEITRVFKNPGSRKRSPQSIEAARTRITDLAKHFAEEMGTPPVSVTLFFNWTRRLHRKEEEAIAKKVAQVVNSKLPDPGENADLECCHGSIQPSEVDQILVNRAYPVASHEWRWMEYSRIERNAVDRLSKIIDEKSKLIGTILQKCDECWLLIVAESFRDSGDIHPDQQSFSHTYASAFGRTYFFDNGIGQLTRLNTVSPQI